MPTERIQRRIDALLDEAEASMSAGDWSAVAEKARAVLGMNPGNEDATAFLNGAEPNLAAPSSSAATSTPAPAAPTPAAPAVPESFAAGRYHVRKFLGEGGKKRVFLAHDALLDRDVAFALIKTEGLDATGRERITREAQAMGRMGTHPHVVTIFEIGEEGGAPYVVTELLGGGDVEGMIEKAGGTVSLARALQVAKDVCDGLVFAHAQGIVHRDLKPGNVWLTADGTAKIGDFGLAVNLGRSRLTQHGLMVGTVAYMPPEQALGGEVTPQSDLYSLGAMLYELVTGKPPFQADDPTAVISQHINTPPVAPSWNSDRCPPDLEDLILQLLAKVPATRPASAKDVLAALERVDPDAKSASHSDSSVNPLDRLARGVFVGRERELERLRGAFDSAFAGRGSVVMLVGEPGIGKTRTTQELETYARLRGAQVYWGRANEQGGAPPCYPWVLTARAYGAQNAEEIRRKEWEPYAVELQRIFTRLHLLFPNLPEPPPVDSEEGQFQLYDAMSGFLRDVSERVPLVVVLDDLHWADRPTLLMLTHLAREISHSRILVVGTYRDTDLDRTHPLSQALGELNRESLFTRILLRGLSEAETAAYIETSAHVQPNAELARRIHVETEGNPFFLSEVVQLMTEEGTLAASSLSDIAIPEGVKEALGRRLDRLGPEANELLSVAAVVGRECSHTLLAALTAFDDDTLLRLVEEALSARVLEETGTAGEYRFTHALMQETLYAELSTARRVRMHGRVAETLERLYANELPLHAAELARHFAEAAVMNHALAERAVHYAELAAQQAEAVAGWDEAARWYEQAIAGMDEGETQSVHAGDLWVAISLCLRAEGRRPESWRAFERAVAAYRAVGDPRALAAGLVRGLDAGWTGIGEALLQADVMLETLSALGEVPSLEACQLLATLAWAHTLPSFDVYEDRARAMASELGLRGASWPWRIEFRALVRMGREDTLESRLLLTERMYGELSGLGAEIPPATRGEPLLDAATALMTHGEIDRAIEAYQRFRAFCQANRLPGKEIYAVDRLAEIAAQRNEVALLAELAPVLERGASVVPARAALFRGDSQLAARLLPDESALTRPADLSARGKIAIRLLLQSDPAKARRLFDEWWRATLATLRAGGSVALGGDSEVIVQLATPEECREYYGTLCARPWVRFGGWMFDVPDVMRGLLALHLGDTDAAERHYNEGLEWARRPDVRFGLVEGRCLQGLADVAEARGDHALAMEHLDGAGAKFAEYGAKLYLDQVLAKKQFLKA